MIPVLVDLAAVLVGGLSGSLLAVRKRFDLVGVATLAIVAGLGGGIIRDVLLQRGPPAALQDSRYLVVGLVAALVGFYKSADIARIERVLTVVDAANLGVYTVVGSLKALLAGLTPVSAVFLGVVTAVGGGVLRDLLAGDTPALFHTGELYAVVSVLGSALFVAFWQSQLVSSTVAGLGAIAVMFVLRLLAVRFGWTAPRPPAPLVALLLASSLLPGRLHAQAAAQRPAVLFAVQLRDRGDSGAATVEPFLVIRGNRVYGPHDSATQAEVLVARGYERAGTTLPLLVGGGATGSVELTPGLSDEHERDAPRGGGQCFSLVRPARFRVTGIGRRLLRSVALASNRGDWDRRIQREPLDATRGVVSVPMLAFIEVAKGVFRSRGVPDSVLTRLAVRQAEIVWVDPEARRAPAVLGVVIQDSSRPASSPSAFVLAEQSRSHMTLALALYRSADLAAAGDVQLLDVLDLNGDGVGELLLRLPKNGAWRYLVFKRLGGEWVKLYEGGGGGC